MKHINSNHWDKVLSEVDEMREKCIDYLHSTRVVIGDYVYTIPYFFATIIITDDKKIHLVEPYKYSSLEIIKCRGIIHQTLDIEDSDELDIIKLFPEILIGVIFSNEYPSGFSTISLLHDCIRISKYIPKLYDKLNAFIDILEPLYGDNFDIKVSLLSNYEYTIVLKYPELIIKNSKKQSHKIRDLYVSFCIDYYISKGEFKVSRYLTGYRGVITTAEAQYDYGHSHLSCGAEGGKFCMGTSELGNMFLIDLIKQFDESNIVLTLFMLDAYLEWESLEGGPYNRIEGITTENIPACEAYIDIPQINKACDYIIKGLKEDNILLPIKYNTTTIGEKDLIIPYTTVEDIQEIIQPYVDNIYCCWYIDGTYTYNNNIEEKVIEISRISNKKIFRDTDIPIIIVKEGVVTKQNIDRLKKVVHPMVTKRISQKLTNKIQELWQNKL